MKDVVWSFAGGMFGIALLGALSQYLSQPLLIAPFGATCVLMFAVPESPLAQPRNIVGGHLLSASIGLAVFMLCGGHWWSLGLAVGGAIAAMQVCRVTHPPAGATTLVAVSTGASWTFLLMPVLAGALTLTALAYLINAVGRKKAYPLSWR